MYLGQDQFGTTGGTASSARPRASEPAPRSGRLARLRGGFTWTPDLGHRIGSLDWWRGLVTLVILVAGAWTLTPGFARALPGATPAALAGADWREARAQGIAPLAWGGDSGRRMAANDLVLPLKNTPERPEVELTGTLTQGDRLQAMLQRAGVGGDDAASFASMASTAVALDAIPAGTRIDLLLGRRDSRDLPRPLERVAFRASFDLNLTLTRGPQGLTMQRQAIAVDNTPLRLQGLIGSSLYRSVRAAGAPPEVVAAFIKALATKVSIGSDLTAGDTFDLVVEQRRAATGEVELGNLLFAGLNRDGKKIQLVRWTDNNWYDPNDEGASRTEVQGFAGNWPVSGRFTSGFGWRLQPFTGLPAMHPGIDIAAPIGTPIRAVRDGIITWASWRGGYGNYVLIDHGGGISTGYGHMSRIAVTPGMRVVRGQVIGYVGSTGFSTGPHCHFEVRRNGVPIDPRTVSFVITTGPAPDVLKGIKARLDTLMAVKAGTAR